MLRQSTILRRRLHQVMDGGLAMLALWLAHWLRGQNLLGRDPIFPFSDYLWLWLVVLPTTWIGLDWLGYYDRPQFFSRRKTAGMLLKCSTATAFAMIVMTFLFREADIARGVLVLYGVISFGALFGKELFFRSFSQSRRGRERMTKRVILVGGNETDLELLRQKLRQMGPGEIQAVAELNLNLSKTDSLIRLLHEYSANAVLVNCAHTNFRAVEKILQACELEGVEAWLVASFFKTQSYRTSLDEFANLPVVVFRSAPEASWQALAKQMLDYAGSLAGLLALSLPMALIALAIRLTSAGPVLFRQERCGLHGQPFVMLKFRTMVSNAEQLKQELAALNEMSGPVFKVTNDPRITRVGRWLRKFSLDELPQLFNVLQGDMSLVGPRPLPVGEVQRFDDVAHRRRLSVKPGLTCLWQVSGRNEVKDFKEWVRLDLEYIDHWSFWLDLKILCRTIPVVIQGTGAK